MLSIIGSSPPLTLPIIHAWLPYALPILAWLPFALPIIWYGHIHHSGTEHGIPWTGTEPLQTFRGTHKIMTAKAVHHLCKPSEIMPSSSATGMLATAYFDMPGSPGHSGTHSNLANNQKGPSTTTKSSLV